MKRQIGVPGAVLMGLGSIVGTGVFVSLGLAVEIAGPHTVPALVLAALVAGLNGTSSAQLAAAFPVSGGTYEYANRTIGPLAGFTAGWMFLCAKTASAATAALGLSGYALGLLGTDGEARVPLALAVTAVLTAVAWRGITQSNRTNTWLVGFTLGTLALLVALAMPTALRAGETLVVVPATADVPALLHGSALLFVSFTGYGRIATLGEEVIEPRHTIPRAIGAALLVVLVLYLGVAIVGIGTLGVEGYARITRENSAPLQAVADRTGGPWLSAAVTAAAITAMLGVLLNLILGLSRIVLAMGRRSDLPRQFARVDRGVTPGPAVLLTGLGIGALVLTGNIATTWSFSAFTVLVYYALTNLAALRLPREERLFPAWTAWTGLAGCLALAVFVQWRTVALGLGLLAAGHLLRAVLHRVWPPETGQKASA